MKGATKAFLAVIIIAGIVLASSVAFGNMDVRLLFPSNNSANSTTNNTQNFLFNFTSNVTPGDCMLRVNGVNASALTAVDNETNTAFKSLNSISQGRYNWSVVCNATASGSATVALGSSNYSFIHFLDTTNPPIATVQSSSPVDYYNTSANETTTFSCNTPAAADNVFDNINLSFVLNGTVNQTIQGVLPNATYNFSLPHPAAANSGYQYNWSCRMVDNASNINQTAIRRITIDRNAPVIGHGANASINRSVGRDFALEYNWSARDMTYITRCYAKVYSTNGSFVELDGTINGSIPLNETSNNVLCNVRISNLTVAMLYGRQTVEFWTSDTPGNNGTTHVNQTNVTVTKLFPGWNIILVDRNVSLEEIGNLSSNITQVSRFNNTAKVFTTFVKGIAANGPVAMQDGEAVYVYANLTTYVARNWTREGGALNVNLTGITYGVKSGWTLLAHLNSSGLNFDQLCKESRLPLIWNLTANYTRVSYYQSNESKFVSHRCDFKYANETFVPMGYGYWAFINETNRTVSLQIPRSP